MLRIRHAAFWSVLWTVLIPGGPFAEVGLAQDDRATVPEPPILVLDTQGFAGSDVRALAFSDDEAWLAVGGGKEVRVWNLETGELAHTLRGYREPESFKVGTINALSFSPNGRYLVVGVTDNYEAGTTRIFDLQDPRQEMKLLPGHTGCTLGAAFSPNGRYLTTYSCSNLLEVHEVDIEAGDVELVCKVPLDWNNREKVDAIRQAGDFFGFPLDDNWILLRRKGQQFVVSLSTGEIVDDNRRWPADIRRLLSVEHDLRGPDRTHPEYTTNTALDLRADRWRVRGGLTRNDGTAERWIAVWSGLRVTPATVYRNHRYTPTRITVSKSGRLVASADALGEIHVWEAATGRRHHWLRPSNRELYGVKWEQDGGSVRFADEHFGRDRYHYNSFGPLANRFDLNLRYEEALPAPPISPNESHRRGQPVRILAGRYRVELKATHESVRASARPKKSGQAMRWYLRATVTDISGGQSGQEPVLRELNCGFDRPMSFAFLPERDATVARLVVGTEGGQLAELALEIKSDGNGRHSVGNLVTIRSFAGHSSFITGLDVDPTGRLLASSATDGTIRFWNIGPPREGCDVPIYTEGNRVTGAKDPSLIGPVAIESGDLLLRFDGQSFYERKRLIAAGRYHVGDKVPLEFLRGDQRMQTVATLVPAPAIQEPVVTLFFSRDGEWIAWTPQGYYDTSPQGEEYIGWHLNRGREQPAEFYRVAQFREMLHRPDILLEALRSADAESAPVVANRRLSPGPTPPGDALDLRSRKQLDAVLPPVLRIIDPTGAVTTDGDKVTLQFEVTSSPASGRIKPRIAVNGRPAQASFLTQTGLVNLPEADRVRLTYRTEIEVSDEENVVTVTAEGRNTASESHKVLVRRAGTEPVDENLPRLFILAVGIAEHQLGQLQLQYADDDAREFAAAFRDQQRRRFREVQTRVIVDDEATVKNIKDGMEWLSIHARDPRDTALVFFSGHSMYDDFGDWRFLTHDVADLQRLESSTLTHDEINNWFHRRVLANAILFVDTCHAAGVTGAGRAKGRPVRPDPWTGSGRLILASSLPDEISLELPRLEHGAFTAAILRALREPARSDRNADRFLTFHELEGFVLEEVPRLTRKKQHPAAHKPGTVSDMVLYEFSDRANLVGR
ncbi:caspase family protein [Maioricimonas rarisocia]|nr:caspase family protein [Maioricimonas rarisocia]